MKKLKQKFMDDPEFAITSVVVVALTAAALLTAVAKVIGSSGYAVHAAKRESHN